MTDEVLFLDTNVLVYLFDSDEPEKRAVARRLLRESPKICLSTQVLAEFYVTVTRKLARPLDPELALRAVRGFQSFPVAAPAPVILSAAIRRSIDSRISFWDGLIVETALAERVDRLVTEDLQDGWQIGSMRIWNPFADSRRA
jgi:predicted nucleic acid-binding protein